MLGPRTKTIVLSGAIVALFVVVGGLLGQYVFGSALAGLIVAIALSLAINLVTYFTCDRLILWSNQARIVRDDELPRLAEIVRELAPRFGLLRPRIALMNSVSPNAFATGRDDRHAVVAVTVGLLRLCDDRELRGVVAHELAHIRDHDILVMTFAATLAGAIAYAAQMVIFSSLLGGRGRGQSASWPIVLLAAIGAPIAAMLIQLAISRSREARADEVGAKTTGDPGALADALQKLAVANARQPMTQGSPAASSLFIVNPYGGSWFANLFSTHPPIQERIQRLRAMGRSTIYTVPIRSPIASGGFPSRSGPA
jgi:heat shock protein HtpX